MVKFRKKPVVIEAQQWFPPGDDRHDPAMLVYRKGNSVSPPDYRKVGDLYCVFDEKLGQGPSLYMIKTLEGDLKVSPGDWIITGVKGEKYPCKPDIFEATYEPHEASVREQTEELGLEVLG